MLVKIPLMIQDPATARYKGMEKLSEPVKIEEDYFLDGPITRRIAVLDFCPESGELLKGARFVPPNPGKKTGKYEIDDENDFYSPGFIQLNVFAAVWKTIYMFERQEVLGRPVSWAFPAEQLLVVPRAGEMANAYYERDSHSIQFFFFPHSKDNDGQKPIFTSLSRDIVAHETGHAILDGIVPHLYDAITPQALALHESIADLTALLMSLTSNKLTKFVVGERKDFISKPNAFSSIADEIGEALETRPLRVLKNAKTLNSKDTSVDRYGQPNYVGRHEPHKLSEVLSGALYEVLVEIYKELWRQKSREFKKTFLCLGSAAKQFKRMVFRALDYLPPGDISFADYGRAIIASDQAFFPKDERTRKWIRDEFKKRHMVNEPNALKVEKNYTNHDLTDIDLQKLVESDWAAYEFADKNRNLLSIPKDASIKVHPRLDVKRHLYKDKVEYRDCIFKVSWVEEEKNTLGSRYPGSHRFTVGTTLVIDWKNHTIRSLLTSKRKDGDIEADEQKQDRDKLLHHLCEKGLLQLGKNADGFDGNPLNSVIKGEVRNGILQVQNTGRMLHLREEYE